MYKSPQIKIRPVEKGDLSYLCAWEEEVFPSDRLSKKQMLYHLRSPRALFLLALLEGNPAGYALFFRRRNSMARFYSLAVPKALQGKGVGRALIRAGLEHLVALGESRVCLEVRADDRRAIDLYISFGFEQGAVLPAYYKDGGAAIKMMKAL